ncbi:MAG TPA: S9 family peptidase [Woeseiaceae bacterium]|nr:S9 family peptidase [Woeseiaceae bacterium]
MKRFGWNTTVITGMRTGAGILLCAVTILTVSATAFAADDGILNIGHWDSLVVIEDPQLSPDGEWVAYTASISDEDTDEYLTSLWMVDWAGEQQIQLTRGRNYATSPRWSPDNKYLAFLAAATDAAAGTQVWVFDRHGGNARQLTQVNGAISDYAWSPDSRKLVLVAKLDDTESPNEGSSVPNDRAKPIVIDRYHFKNDESGYVTGSERNKIYLYNIVDAQLSELTNARNTDEYGPIWSPDGSKIAFYSNRDTDPDRSANTNIYLADAQSGAALTQLTDFKGQDNGPLSFSRDGRLVAYLQGPEPKFMTYHSRRLAIVPTTGGPSKYPAPGLQRDGEMPTFTADGRFLDVIIADDRSKYLARISVDENEVERLTQATDVVHAYSRAGDRTVVLIDSVGVPAEIFALEQGGTRQLTHQNDGWLTPLTFGAVEGISFRSTDEQQEIRGLLTRPPWFNANKKYPALLLIHGGPYMQDMFGFDFERQYFAAKGYVVIQVNYRGSKGRGPEFAQAIFADWGNKDTADVIAGVDHVVKMGIVDPGRLGVAGWSQGGIITNYVIASDKRFKAAVSGAGTGNQLAMYGTDEYIFVYDHEFRPPWEDPDLWIKMSYPFFNADRIKTPTLYIGGEKDFNVPIIGGEQMYQALKSLGVPTQLVIYPGEYHTFSSPTFDKDVFERYAAWLGTYLQPEQGNTRP